MFGLFKRKASKDPVTLKDHVEQEKRSMGQMFKEASEAPPPAPVDTSSELWRTRCTELVEFIVFNAGVARINPDDCEQICIDFQDEHQSLAMLQELEDLKVQLKSNGQHSDMDIEMPEEDEEDDW